MIISLILQHYDIRGRRGAHIQRQTRLGTADEQNVPVARFERRLDALSASGVGDAAYCGLACGV